MQVFPDYRRSVYNVPHTLIGMLDSPNPLMLEEFRDLHINKLIFILIDALGYELFERYVKDKIDGAYSKITSLFPSTTAAVLTTIYTGLSPKEHGILEWYMYYEEYGGIIKTLPFSPMDAEGNDILMEMGISPEPLFNHPTIFQRLKERGIDSASYIRWEYAHSSYSEHMFKGSTIVPYSTLEEAFKKMRGDERDLIQIYIDYVDTAQHLYGPYSRETRMEIEKILKHLEILGNEATIVIVADHGQMEIRKKKIVQLHNQKISPAGSPRDMFLYAQEPLDGNFNMLSKEDFIKLLGPGKENRYLRRRAPELVILPEDFTGVWFRDFYAKGLHGGMSPQEMYVPFIVIEGKI